MIVEGNTTKSRGKNKTHAYNIEYGVFDIIIIVTTLQWNWIGNGYNKDSNYVGHIEKFTIKLIVEVKLDFYRCPFYAIFLWLFGVVYICHSDEKNNATRCTIEGTHTHKHPSKYMQLSCVAISIHSKFRALQLLTTSFM